MMPQPVPQKRQAALSQRQPFSASSAALRLLGKLMPATLQAVAAAELFIKSRLSMRLTFRLELISTKILNNSIKKQLSLD